MKKYFQRFVLLITVFYFAPSTIVGAQAFEPEEETFYVSGYYSPLEGQSFYLRGDLEKEKRLNGAGIHGASGKDVYSGMLAAPKSYEFGTKIKLEGVGIGTVDDRGGAIVEAGKRGNSYDRIDIWMGYGEEGLKRALTWGLRKVVGYVYPASMKLSNSIDVSQFSIVQKKWPTITDSSLFPRNLGKGFTGNDVQKLQEILVELGYLDQDPGESYDTKTIDAIYRFQIDEGIIHKDTEEGAGYFGSKTKKALEKRWYDLQERQRKEIVALKTEKQKMINDFPVHLGKNTGSKEDIIQLQTALLDLGYTVQISGYYDTVTIKAVRDYQKRKGIIKQDTDYGAGYFGSQTKLFLVEDLWQNKITEQKSLILATTSNEMAHPVSVPHEEIQDPLSKNLDKKSMGPAVIELQKKLQELEYFTANPTGYYGPKTETAVLTFQQKYKLIGTPRDKGAGIFGPLTRGKLNSVYQQYHNSLLLQELDKGDNGIEVVKLQRVLKKLGYFHEEVTGKFGDITKRAVLLFQKDHHIINKNDDVGAGRVGQETKKVLNEEILHSL